MKRPHLYVAIDDLNLSAGFYSTLFAAKPVVVRDNYLKCERPAVAEKSMSSGCPSSAPLPGLPA